MGVIAGIGAGIAGLGALAGTAGGIWTNQKNQEFAEEMSSTAYQRSVADMRSAGLSPNAIYGSGGGSPSSSPGGQMENPISGQLANSVKAGVDISQGLASTDKVKEDTQLTKAATDVQRANARMAHSNADVVEKENTAYKAALSGPGGEVLAAQKKYGGSDALSGAYRTATTALGSVGNAMGGFHSARELGAAYQNRFGDNSEGPVLKWEQFKKKSGG